MSLPATHLGDIAVADFLAEYWQKKPVLLRGVFRPWKSPIKTDDLLGLATREDAESRLILTGEATPELYHGPFEAGELEDLPDDEWTVLVQEVDRLIPSVSALLDEFRFIPNWRLDDVMVSYAAPGGGVGAHTDQYDVFLIQGSGRRRWEIETSPRDCPVWKEDSEVAILAEFDPDQSWELEPGDVLYLPPRIPHNGIAIEACLTLSVGCRAPSTAELLTGILSYAAESWEDADRYSDPDLTVPEHPGLFPVMARDELKSRIRQALADDDVLDNWLGRFVTEPLRGHTGAPPRRWISRSTVLDRLSGGARLRPAVVSQIAYVERPDRLATIYAGGQSYPDVPLAAARALTGPARPGADLLPILEDERTMELVLSLVNAGALVID